jgi:hypothetical protein
MVFTSDRPSLGELEYYKANELCMAQHRTGGWWAYGSAEVVVATAIMAEVARRQARNGYIDCMKAHGFSCSEGCN